LKIEQKVLQKLEIPFTGVYTQRQIDLLFPNLMVRKEKYYNRGVVVYFKIFVDSRELNNYILEIGECLRQEKEKIDKQEEIHEMLSMVPEMDMNSKNVPEGRICIGSYANFEEARANFDYKSLCKGGGADCRNELVSVPYGKGKIKTFKATPLYYFFIDKKEFIKYLEDLKTKIDENYIFYGRMSTLANVMANTLKNAMEEFEGG